MLQLASSEYNPKFGRLYSTKLKCPRCSRALVKQRFRAEVARRRSYDYHLWCTGCRWNKRSCQVAQRAYQ
jgi:hypothetical protein